MRPGHHYAAFLPPEEPVALFVAFQQTRFAQPGFVILPPVAKALLPGKPRVVHIAIQRFRKWTVDVYRAGMQRRQDVIKGGEPASARKYPASGAAKRASEKDEKQTTPA